ncbi:MAG: hypothetical protein KF712_21465 [Akkermansiaceae bacterium]|nr:hypothetical protein [Akkermansiaceae bacterium]
MKVFRIFQFLLIYTSVISSGVYSATIYPESEDPNEFSRQVEEFIIARSSSGGLRDVYDRTNENLLKEDKRDWEETFARMMRKPQDYGINRSFLAFEAARFRGKAKDARIVAALPPLLSACIQDAEERYSRYAAQGKSDYPLIRAGLAGFIPGALESGSPEILQSILDFMISPADQRINLTESKSTDHVVSALQEYGNPNHIEAATILSEKLREKGKADIADDIVRSVERIKKHAGRKQATSTGRTGESSNDASTPDGEATKSASEKPLWPWIAAGGALIAALVAYLRMKRTQA